jgi:hypothetical protein
MKDLGIPACVQREFVIRDNIGAHRACRKRPHSRRAAEKRDEVAPFQLIELHLALPAQIGRPIKGGLTLLQLANQPTCATRSWASAPAAVAVCAGSWSTAAS